MKPQAKLGFAGCLLRLFAFAPRRHARAIRVLLPLLLFTPLSGWAAEEREFFSTNINRLKIIVTSNELPAAVIQAHITNQFIKARNSLDDRSALGLRVEGDTYQLYVKAGYPQNDQKLNSVVQEFPNQVMGGLYHFYVADEGGKRLLATYTNIYDLSTHHFRVAGGREKMSQLCKFEIDGVYTNKTGSDMAILFKSVNSMILHVGHPFTSRQVSYLTPFTNRLVPDAERGSARPLVGRIQIDGSSASLPLQLVIFPKSGNPRYLTLSKREEEWVWMETRISGSHGPAPASGPAEPPDITHLFGFGVGHRTFPAKPLDIPYKKSSAQPDIVEFNPHAAPRPRIQP